MGDACQVFVDLAFQGRLHRADELVVAEILFFTTLLEEHGMAVLDVPGYCLTIRSGAAKPGSGRIAILLKVRGVWTPLWLEIRAPDVFILYDR